MPAPHFILFSITFSNICTLFIVDCTLSPDVCTSSQFQMKKKIPILIKILKITYSKNACFYIIPQNQTPKKPQVT